MERVLRALGETDVALKACDPLDNLCVSSEAKEALIRELRLRKEKEPERVLSQKIWDASCTICRLFGSPWLASRLSFEDARLINIQDLMEVTQIRDGVGIDRDRGAAKEGIKYDFEVVSPEAKFGISILAENVQTWEIGMLLAILRPWQEGLISIGGKSTRGPGWGKLSNIIIKRVEKEHLLDYLLRGEMAQISEGDLIKDFETRLPLGGINHA
jgi:CRISPR-associated RAMP protein (TIGR02581 family)